MAPHRHTLSPLRHVRTATHVTRFYRGVILALAGVFAVAWSPSAEAVDGVYETNLDPEIGFNVISWWDGTQGFHWEQAIDRLHNAGFRSVSLSPLRFADIRTGRLLTDAESSRGSPLASLEAGLARAKELGLRVTLNPFIELHDSQDDSYFADVPGAGGCNWRGCWNPTGSVSTTFFADYEAYLEEVATLAADYDVDRLSVGTELRQIVGNPANNPHWSQVINAVDAAYDGPIGYAANWDHWAFGQPGNVTQAIFDHPAIDWVGVDAYFTNLVSQSAADNSGTHPNESLIGQVESAWNNLLDNNLLPYAAARNGGEGLPLVFTEFGHLPFNRTTLDPQNQSNAAVLDQDEQLAAFAGFFNALDGRRESVPAVDIWQWEIAGSNGSLWNINPGPTPDQPNNSPLAEFLVDFVSTATVGGAQAVGDFNGDGQVDAADYTVWRNALGTTLTTADATGDGLVDSADYLVWRGNFGSGLSGSSATATAVPEPHAGHLVLLGLALSGRKPRRAAHHSTKA